MVELERRVYSGWAFTSNESEKAAINRGIYKEMKDKALQLCLGDEVTEEMKATKMVYKWAGSGYANHKYQVYSNPENLSNSEIALLIDKGNLCFGYRNEGYADPAEGKKYIIIYED